MSVTHATIAGLGLFLLQADGPSRASQPLLDKLTEAQSGEEAGRLEKDVWDAWLSEAGPTIDIMMERVINALEEDNLILARDLLDRIILIDPTYAEAWHRRATVFYAEDQYDEAIADLEEALKREPRHFGAWIGLGVIFESIGENAAALEAFRNALLVHPHSQLASRSVERLRPLVEGRSL